MNWPAVTLGEICKPKQHKTIPSSELLEDGYVVFGANGPIGYYSAYTHDRKTIAVTCRGATCGTINIVPPQSYITGNAMALDDIDEDKVNLDYLTYALKHQGFNSVINGAAQPQITRGPLLTYTVPLPPLEEQRRIAAILDQADALRRLRRRALDRLNTLGQAIFHQMFEIAADTEFAVLKDLGAVKTGSTPSTKVAEFFNGDVPFITPGDLETDRSVARFLTEAGAEKSRTVKAGSILVCCIGATIGKTDIAPEYCAFNQQINAVEWAPDISPAYGFYAVKGLRREIERIGRGASTTLPILKKSLFQQLEIPIVAKPEQKKFSERLDAVNSQIDQIKLSNSATDRLFESLQSRAFQGEL